MIILELEKMILKFSQKNISLRLSKKHLKNKTNKRKFNQGDIKKHYKAVIMKSVEDTNISGTELNTGTGLTVFSIRVEDIISNKQRKEQFINKLACGNHGATCI